MRVARVVVPTGGDEIGLVGLNGLGSRAIQDLESGRLPVKAANKFLSYSKLFDLNIISLRFRFRNPNNIYKNLCEPLKLVKINTSLLFFLISSP